MIPTINIIINYLYFHYQFLYKKKKAMRVAPDDNKVAQ